MDASQIEQIVFGAIRNINLARPRDKQLEVAPHAAIFGCDSPLDSLGLVALLIDVEEAFAAEGVDLTLSDERAMSQRRSPFRTAATLVEYVQAVVGATV